MKTVWVVILGLFLLPVAYTEADAKPYRSKLCNNPDYTCYRVKRGESWRRLFKNPEERYMIQRINRMNTGIWAGTKIAIPKALGYADELDYAPFKPWIDPQDNKTIMVDLMHHAWGAYNKSGRLLRWGALSGGKGFCRDVNRGCRTIRGKFKVYSKQGSWCKSRKFPLGRGGAPMPYCMFFYKGFALHGSPTVPGYHASHGCVRLFKSDAKWLNEEFVDVKGNTHVIVLPYYRKPSMDI